MMERSETVRRAGGAIEPADDRAVRFHLEQFAAKALR
jgi:hypothetical protein